MTMKVHRDRSEVTWGAASPGARQSSPQVRRCARRGPCLRTGRLRRGNREGALAGFSMVDLAMALFVLMIGLSALLRSVVGSARLGQVNRDTAAATLAVRGIIEQLSGEDDFALVFARYNTVTADDPVGPDPSPGSGFAVEGLSPDPSDPDGLVGELLFPTAAGAPAVLSEVSPGFPGLPRDLDLDGDPATPDVTADYELLPVLVRLRWRSPSGVRTMQVLTLLGDRG